MSNPFLGYGTPVFGERLIGRKKELAKLKEYISNSTASISIVGQRRIGKTSLITEAKRSLSINSSNNLVLIFLDLSIFDNNAINFFKAIMEDIEEYLLDSGLEISPKFQRALSKEAETPYDAYRRCRRGLVLLNQDGINTKLIIDEFDAVRKFEGADQIIQWLRELIDKGFETGLSVVFLSRRSLFSIEKQIVHVSNIDHVCEKLYLKPLSFDELCLLINRCDIAISTSIEEHKLVNKYTGGHPYLSEMILYHSCEQGDIEQGIKQSISEIYNFYEHLKLLLEEDDLFDQLTQLTVGPQWKLKINSALTLLNYGLIVSCSGITQVSHSYLAWSEHFQSYLEKTTRESPVWEKWAHTESLLRDLIEGNLMKAYGADWVATLKGRKNNIPKIIHNCEKIMESEEKKFGNIINQRWIEYTYPNDLWQIISLEWHNFRTTLQADNQRKNKKYWAGRFELLSKIRNPLAHNRKRVLSEQNITLANAYCSELCEVISINTHQSDINEEKA